MSSLLTRHKPILDCSALPWIRAENFNRYWEVIVILLFDLAYRYPPVNSLHRPVKHFRHILNCHKFIVAHTCTLVSEMIYFEKVLPAGCKKRQLPNCLTCVKSLPRFPADNLKLEMSGLWRLLLLLMKLHEGTALTHPSLLKSERAEMIEGEFVRYSHPLYVYFLLTCSPRLLKLKGI